MRGARLWRSPFLGGNSAASRKHTSRLQIKHATSKTKLNQMANGDPALPTQVRTCCVALTSLTPRRTCRGVVRNGGLFNLGHNSCK